MQNIVCFFGKCYPKNKGRIEKMEADPNLNDISMHECVRMKMILRTVKLALNLIGIYFAYLMQLGQQQQQT